MTRCQEGTQVHSRQELRKWVTWVMHVGGGRDLILDGMIYILLDCKLWIDNWWPTCNMLLN